MSLKDVQIKDEYRSLIDNVVQDFYIPLLERAVMYKRAVGFFSSSSLVELTKGIATMAQRGGKIQIVASPYLSEEDIEAIQKGYSEREKVIEQAVLRQITGETVDYFSMQRLNLLSCLIADGILDIRIAYTEGKNGIGMYHEKMGVIEDDEGNAVAFSGSMNESATAMSINYETIDVFRSWGDENESDRVRLKQNAFCSIWNDGEPNIRVLSFPSISQALIEKYKKSPPNFNIDREQFPPEGKNTRVIKDGSVHLTTTAVGPRIPQNICLHDYQKEAIASWVGENYHGIFDMATGTGKTFTGLGAISKLSEDLNDKLAVIIVCPYQHLVEQWVEDIVRFNMKPIIGFSSSPQRDWKQRLSKAVRDQKLRVDKSFFCFVCTNATFTNKDVQEQINKIRSPILLVVDEAHNFGAASYARLLDERFTYRLALSATLERHRDEEGTALLYHFFGKKCIEYTLERAIKEDKLDGNEYVADAEDVRQIEAVTYILGIEMGMEVAQFTSNENMETRAMIKEQFQRGDRLQVIVAIKCLDEGVNIPGIRTAFILASTTNPKEYIQRRGRVLRKAPNKPYAEIYDFVTLPRPLDSVASLTKEQAQRDLSLVKNELARIKEFGRLAQNSMDANNLIWDIQDAYHISDEESEEGAFDYGAD